MDVMTGVKWAVGWRSKEERAAMAAASPPPLTPEELREKMLRMEENRPALKGDPIKPIVYTLPPIGYYRKTKRLPSQMKNKKMRLNKIYR